MYWRTIIRQSIQKIIPELHEHSGVVGLEWRQLRAGGHAVSDDRYLCAIKRTSYWLTVTHTAWETYCTKNNRWDRCKYKIFVYVSTEIFFDILTPYLRGNISKVELGRTIEYGIKPWMSIETHDNVIWIRDSFFDTILE